MGGGPTPPPHRFHPPPPPWKIRYPLYRKLGGPQGRRADLDGWGKSRPPNGIRSPDRPARSESLYQLSYPGPHFTYIYYWVLSGWSGFAVNSDHRIFQKTEELFCSRLFHEIRVSKFFISVLMGKRMVTVKDVMFCYLLEPWNILPAIKS
jgi:hypothetical protein